MGGGSGGSGSGLLGIALLRQIFSLPSRGGRSSVPSFARSHRFDITLPTLTITHVISTCLPHPLTVSAAAAKHHVQVALPIPSHELDPPCSGCGRVGPTGGTN